MDGAQISMTVALVVQAVVLVIGMPDRRPGRLVRRPPRQLPDAVHGRHLCVPRPAVHHPADGRLPRDLFGRALDGLLLVFVAIGLTSWVTVARLVRGQLLSLKETEFVEAARPSA